MYNYIHVLDKFQNVSSDMYEHVVSFHFSVKSVIHITFLPFNSLIFYVSDLPPVLQTVDLITSSLYASQTPAINIEDELEMGLGGDDDLNQEIQICTLRGQIVGIRYYNGIVSSCYQNVSLIMCKVI